MKMLAGLKLNGRKPTQMPAVTTASSGPTLEGSITPTSSSRQPYRKNEPAPIATIPAARPSSPSIRFTALAIPTTHRTVISADMSGGSTVNPRNGTRK